MNRRSFLRNILFASAYLAIPSGVKAICEQPEPQPLDGFKITGATRQWATGAITTQREYYIKTVTYTEVGASTITNAYTLWAEAPTASSNPTINETRPR